MKISWFWPTISNQSIWIWFLSTWTNESHDLYQSINPSPSLIGWLIVPIFVRRRPPALSDTPLTSDLDLFPLLSCQNEKNLIWRVAPVPGKRKSTFYRYIFQANNALTPDARHRSNWNAPADEPAEQGVWRLRIRWWRAGCNNVDPIYAARNFLVDRNVNR